MEGRSGGGGGAVEWEGQWKGGVMEGEWGGRGSGVGGAVEWEGWWKGGAVEWEGR